MNKAKLMTKLLVGLIIALLIVGCSGGKKHESTGEYFDDMVLSTKVRTSILADSRLKLSQIDIETYKGVVQLSGFVDTSDAANRAADLARRVRGVKMVNNSLIVK